MTLTTDSEAATPDPTTWRGGRVRSLRRRWPRAMRGKRLAIYLMVAFALALNGVFFIVNIVQSVQTGRGLGNGDTVIIKHYQTFFTDHRGNPAVATVPLGR
jgi:hypothetical protein